MHRPGSAFFQWMQDKRGEKNPTIFFMQKDYGLTAVRFWNDILSNLFFLFNPIFMSSSHPPSQVAKRNGSQRHIMRRCYLLRYYGYISKQSIVLANQSEGQELVPHLNASRYIITNVKEIQRHSSPRHRSEHRQLKLWLLPTTRRRRSSLSEERNGSQGSRKKSNVRAIWTQSQWNILPKPLCQRCCKTCAKEKHPHWLRPMRMQSLPSAVSSQLKMGRSNVSSATICPHKPPWAPAQGPQQWYGLARHPWQVGQQQCVLRNTVPSTTSCGKLGSNASSATQCLLQLSVARWVTMSALSAPRISSMKETRWCLVNWYHVCLPMIPMPLLFNRMWIPGWSI